MKKDYVAFSLRVERAVYQAMKEYQAAHKPRMSLAGIVNEAIEKMCLAEKDAK